MNKIKMTSGGMTTKQVNVRLPEVVIHDLNQLSKIYGSQAKALIVAIVNLKKETQVSIDLLVKSAKK